MLVAMEIGREKLLGDKGIQLLVDAIHYRIFPAERAAARELFPVTQRTARESRHRTDDAVHQQASMVVGHVDFS